MNLYRESTDFVNSSFIMEEFQGYGAKKQKNRWEHVDQTAGDATQTVLNPTQTAHDTTQSQQNPTQTAVNPTQTVTVRMSDYDRDLLQAVIKSPFISQRELAGELGWNLDRVKYYMKKWKDKGCLCHVESSHKGYWKVLVKIEHP